MEVMKRKTTVKEMKHRRLLAISIDAIFVNDLFEPEGWVLEMKCGRREKSVVLGIIMNGDGVYIGIDKDNTFSKTWWIFFFSLFVFSEY